MRFRPSAVPSAVIIREKTDKLPAMTLAERVEEARARLDASETIASACYWQGALRALESFSAGSPMPDVIGE